MMRALAGNRMVVMYCGPLTQERVKVVGINGEPLPHLVDQVVEIVRQFV